MIVAAERQRVEDVDDLRYAIAAKARRAPPPQIHRTGRRQTVVVTLGRQPASPRDNARAEPGLRLGAVSAPRALPAFPCGRLSACGQADRPVAGRAARLGQAAAAHRAARASPRPATRARDGSPVRARRRPRRPRTMVTGSARSCRCGKARLVEPCPDGGADRLRHARRASTEREHVARAVSSSSRIVASRSAAQPLLELSCSAATATRIRRLDHVRQVRRLAACLPLSARVELGDQRADGRDGAEALEATPQPRRGPLPRAASPHSGSGSRRSRSTAGFSYAWPSGKLRTQPPSVAIDVADAHAAARAR